MKMMALKRKQKAFVKKTVEEIDSAEDMEQSNNEDGGSSEPDESSQEGQESEQSEASSSDNENEDPVKPSDEGASDEDASDEDASDEDDGNSSGDVESGAEESGAEESGAETNEGWADSMSKILKSNKPKGKRSLVLSKAKKISDIKKPKTDDLGFEIIGDSKEEKPVIENIKIEEDEPKLKKRREDEPDFRLKPNILEKEREKVLSKIATRGVVQLFNAVRNQQKDIEKKIEEAGPLERKKDKVMKSLNKTQFLDILMGQSKSENVNKLMNVKSETKKEKIKKEKEPASNWNVFREDFMMGAKMKDWDKNEPKESENEEVSELSDSD